MYKKILAPLDGSNLSECSLPHVAAVASGCNVPEVILFRVVETIYIGTDSSPDSGIVYSQLIEQNQKEAEKYITSITDKVKQQYGLNAQPVLAYGNPAEQMLDYAERNRIDLIIMTTHGRSGVSRLLFGSVADRVSRHSTVPILIIAPPGCRVDNKNQNKKEKV
jgi:nucleotide-binding universal stress UspA family protein